MLKKPTAIVQKNDDITCAASSALPLCKGMTTAAKAPVFVRCLLTPQNSRS